MVAVTTPQAGTVPAAVDRDRDRAPGASRSVRPLWRSLALYREMPWRFGLTAVLFAIVNLSLAWQQWLVGRAVHDVERGVAVVRAADGTLDFSVAWTWFAILVAVALVRGVVQYGAGLLSLVISQDLLSLLRERILVQVQRLDLAYHWLHGVGELVTRTTRDADKLRDALVSFWRQVFEVVLVVGAAIGMLMAYNLWLGVVPLLLIMAAVAIFVRQTDHLVTLDRAVGAAYDHVNQDLSEGINGVRVIKSFVLEARRVDGFTRQVRTFMDQARHALAYSTSRVPLPQVIVALGQVWILVFGVYLVSRSRLNLGELVAALLMANTLVFRVEGVGRVMQVFADARSSAARIWDLLDAEPGIVGGHAILPDAPLGLRFSQVRVAAPGDGVDILRDCSFTVAPGEIVALVGATGAGKSTLAGLLPRLLDVHAGSVALGSDALGWTDVRNIALDPLRRSVQVVPQEAFLFSDSLQSNLLLGAPHASEDDLLRALHIACADEVVARLPEGLDTRIGDRGITLSGGQRQRLALARALVAQPRLLGLDDATSALDAITEQQLLSRLRELRHDPARATTVLMVASKLSTILQADRVLLLVDGRIAAEGRHEVLLDSHAVYRDLLGLEHGD